MRVSVFVPAFQEENLVGELLRRVIDCDVGREGFDREIIVCDDGSTDGTAEAIARVAETAPGLRFLRHSRNRGKGAAIRTMLAHASGDCVFIQDADLEYEVEDCLPLLRAFRAGNDAVYGSRFLETRHPAGMRLQNLVANRVLTGTANALYRLRLTDEATCLKVIRTSLLRAMDLKCERFEFCPEVTAKLALMGVRIHEVPVRYRARDFVNGKKIGWRDGVEALKTLFEHWPIGS